MTDTNGSGWRRRRSWPEALKQEIVAASLEPGASVSLVARRYDPNTNQLLFNWRRLYRDGRLAQPGPALVPVTIAAQPECAVEPPQSAMDTIEIEVPGGYRVRVRVGSGVDARTLRRVLDVLARR